MAYSLDLRQRVVDFVASGGEKSEASRRFKVSLWCVKTWCKRKILSTTYSHMGRPRKVDWEALRQDIQQHPDKLIRERAAAFGVYNNSIWYASRAMKITHKKNTSLPREKS